MHDSGAYICIYIHIHVCTAICIYIHSHVHAFTPPTTTPLSRASQVGQGGAGNFFSTSAVSRYKHPTCSHMSQCLPWGWEGQPHLPLPAVAAAGTAAVPFPYTEVSAEATCTAVYTAVKAAMPLGARRGSLAVGGLSSTAAPPPPPPAAAPAARGVKKMR